MKLSSNSLTSGAIAINPIVLVGIYKAIGMIEPSYKSYSSSFPTTPIGALGIISVYYLRCLGYRYFRTKKEWCHIGASNSRYCFRYIELFLGKQKLMSLIIQPHF